MNDLVTDLQMLIRQPSVSAKKNGIVECAHLVKNVMEKAGIRTELLYLDEKNYEYKNEPKYTKYKKKKKINKKKKEKKKVVFKRSQNFNLKYIYTRVKYF